MWVDDEPKAIEWAINHDASIHPQTGLIQVFDTSYVDDMPPQAKTSVSLPEEVAHSQEIDPLKDVIPLNPERNNAVSSISIIENDEKMSGQFDESIKPKLDHKPEEAVQFEEPIQYQEVIQSEKSSQPERNIKDEERSITPDPIEVNDEKSEVLKEPQSMLALFHAYTADQLLSLGVPSIYLNKVCELPDLPALKALQNGLPEEVYEALILLANGSDYQTLLETYNDAINETVDVKDYATALARVGSQRQFKLLSDDQDLENMLNAPLEKWRVFLHPSQRKLVELEAKGPTRVLGGPGTGKTVVAMHRAVYLAKKLIEDNDTDKRILLTTFTSILARDIRNNLQHIATHDQLNLIEVQNIDAWVETLLRNQGYDYRLVYEDDPERESCWKKAMEYLPTDLNFAETFYQEEWRHIILQYGIRTRGEYLKANRNGRGTALDRMEKAKVWEVFVTYRELLESRKIREIYDAFHDLLEIVQNKDLQLPYSSVVVDEAQDIGAAGFTFASQDHPRGCKRHVYRRRWTPANLSQ